MMSVLVVAKDANGPEFGKASPLALLIIVILLVATVFLIRSMSKRVRRLPESFSPEHPQADQAADDGTDSSGLVDGAETSDAETTDGAASSDSDGGRTTGEPPT